MNHYPHHIGDFAKDTLGFNQGAIGAYRLLMDAYYANEEAPAAEDVYVIGRGIDAITRRNVDKALTKFDLRDGRYFHKRVEEELEAYRNRADAARENGKKGGRKPKHEPANNPSGTGEESRSEPEASQSRLLASNHKPISPSLRSGEKRRKRAPKHPIPEGFGLSVRVIDWAKAKGYEHLQEHLDAFRLKAAANDYRYADWESAFMNAIESDWAGLRRNGARNEKRGADAIEGAMRLTAERDANAAH